jgi:hypothetical protein
VSAKNGKECSSYSIGTDASSGNGDEIEDISVRYCSGLVDFSLFCHQLEELLLYQANHELNWSSRALTDPGELIVHATIDQLLFDFGCAVKTAIIHQQESFRFPLWILKTFYCIKV